MKATQRFTKKIAQKIAHKSLAHVLCGILGHMDEDYHLYDSIDVHTQNFEEDIEEAGYNATPGRLKEVEIQYGSMKRSIEKKIEAAMNFPYGSKLYSDK